jgi:RNA polymerase sigma-70 factor (ECF subfamily)
MGPTTDIEEGLRDAHRAGSETWAGVELDVADFRAWILERQISSEALADRGADLYLAAACARATPAAVAAFDRAFLQEPGPIGRSSLRPEQMDELRQILRVNLLTGPQPRISTFKGHGPLAAWVRVAAAREAAHLQSGGRGTDLQDGALMDALEHLGADPEVLTARGEHRAAFRAVLAECLSALGAREKTLLRMNFLDHMNIDEIGVVYRVHRATVARWLAAIRTQVFECVSAKLSIKLRSSPSEVASLVRLVRSEIDLSIGRLLVDDPALDTEIAAQRRRGARED